MASGNTRSQNVTCFYTLVLVRIFVETLGLLYKIVIGHFFLVRFHKGHVDYPVTG